MRVSRVACTLTLVACTPVQAQFAAPLPMSPPVMSSTTSASVMPKLPVREVTVFKDGHAFVLQEGALP